MDRVLTANADNIDESRYPIWCKECHYSLRGLGEKGRCPECGLRFRRSDLLVDLYGPEAFLSSEQKENVNKRTFWSGLPLVAKVALVVVLCFLLIPISSLLVFIASLLAAAIRMLLQ